jgi:hypothetical protein
MIEIFPDQPTLDIVTPTEEERKQTGKKWLYELVDHYIYEDMDAETPFRIVVPKGFRHDGASVPRIGFTISGLTQDGQLRAAALIHDFLYRYDGKPPAGSSFVLYKQKWVPYGLTLSRKQADQLFLKIMKLSGVRWSQRWAAYVAVRVGAPRW